MRIIYSFNKSGFEADYWTREIAAASDARHRFIPFNHGLYLDPRLYERAQLLDNLYYARAPRLLRLYEDLRALIAATEAKVLVADNGLPYHPEFLRGLDVYKVLRTSDGPVAAYDRDLAYLHAYDHVLYHTTAYSRDMTMAEKLAYCGAKKADHWPMGSFDALCEPTRTAETVLDGRRDIDVIFIGALHADKMPLLAEVKKALGRRFRLYGLGSFKRKLYFSAAFGVLAWVRTARFEDYVPLYRRAKIGINVHNRGDYSVGNYRLFDLPRNGVMQISDGGDRLDDFFSTAGEIVPYRSAGELIERVSYYLDHDEERRDIALNGFRRVLKDYRIADLLRRAGEIIRRGMTEKARRAER